MKQAPALRKPPNFMNLPTHQIKITLYRLLPIAVAIFGFQTIAPANDPDFSLSVEQITFGSKHHFFGYIGQSKTIPWNASGRYIVAMRNDFHDRLPGAKDAVDIILIDTEDNYSITLLDQSRGWNLQQGTMLYWNPLQPETQFFFNDRDPVSGRVFTVLYDISTHKRIHEYRYPSASIGNSGVAPSGTDFLAINYGRLARLRPVTGYAGALDETEGTFAPDNDGIFKIDIKTGKSHLLVSYKEIAKHLSKGSYKQLENGRWTPVPKSEIVDPENQPDISKAQLYINHTLWSRNNRKIYFIARGKEGKHNIWIDAPCTINADGTGLTLHSTSIGGHPEWAKGNQIIGENQGRQAIYDVSKKRILENKLIGDKTILPKPGGDVSLSPNGKWFVNGHSSDDRKNNIYTIVRLADEAYRRSDTFSRGPYTKGDLRIDPAPRWNRDNNEILVSGWTKEGSRQLFIIKVTD